MSEEMIRAFFAVELKDKASLDKIVNYQTSLQKSIGPLKLVSPEIMHVTMRFLGNISVQDSKLLYEFLQKEINDVYFPNGKSMSGDLMGVGDFSKKVFFVKIQGIWDVLRDINRIIEKKLVDFQTIKPEIKEFKPHLTIARVKRVKNKRNKKQNHLDGKQLPKNQGQIPYSSLKQEYQNFNFGKWVISRVVLKKSVLTPQGPIYTDIVY